MKSKYKKELILLFILIVSAIFLRSLYFKESLNFATDQATTSSVAFDIWHDKKPTLIGPRFTLEYNGRFMFMGPAIYYMQLFFLGLGNFEPIASSYFFTIFASLMIIPLYFGMKFLINQKAAIFMVIIYGFLPYFVDYTKFLWNPTFQLSLLPLLILAMGLFNKNHSWKSFLGISLILGLVLQFHYTFFLIIFTLGVYYFGFLKLGLRYLGIFIGGIILANCWLIIFELRNHFYFLDTLGLFLSHLNEVAGNSYSSNGSSPHYYLTVVFMGLVVFSWFIRNQLNTRTLSAMGVGLFLVSLMIYSQKPTGGFRMAENWSYLDELKAHQIIVENQVENYNLSNLIYDTKAEVQKYLLKKEGVKFNNDYLSNDYLFILTPPKDYLNDAAFEIKNLKPSEEIKSWPIDTHFHLYLAHRNLQKKVE